jgi:hypothetical protein
MNPLAFLNEIAIVHLVLSNSSYSIAKFEQIAIVPQYAF